MPPRCYLKLSSEKQSALRSRDSPLSSCTSETSPGPFIEVCAVCSVWDGGRGTLTRSSKWGLGFVTCQSSQVMDSVSLAELSLCVSHQSMNCAELNLLPFRPTPPSSLLLAQPGTRLPTSRLLHDIIISPLSHHWPLVISPMSPLKGHPHSFTHSLPWL